MHFIKGSHSTPRPLAGSPREYAEASQGAGGNDTRQASLVRGADRNADTDPDSLTILRASTSIIPAEYSGTLLLPAGGDLAALRIACFRTPPLLGTALVHRRQRYNRPDGRNG